MGPPGASVSGPPVRVLCALCSVLEACWGQGSYCWEEGTGLTPRGGVLAAWGMGGEKPSFREGRPHFLDGGT